MTVAAGGRSELPPWDPDDLPALVATLRIRRTVAYILGVYSCGLSAHLPALELSSGVFAWSGLAPFHPVSQTKSVTLLRILAGFRRP